MPILVRSMRDIWDKGRAEKGESARCEHDGYALPPSVRKYFFEYHISKNAWKNHKIEMAEIFQAYKERLGEAGFLDINL